MKLQKPDEYTVDESDPWKSDKLDRKRVADYLTPVIASVTQPFTISLHSPYGTGKTSFIKSWQADLRKQGYKTVYFNAWETDFSHDAFFAFMSAVQSGLAEQAPTRQKSKAIAAKVSETAKKGAGLVGEKAIPLILRGLAAKFAGDETVQGVLKLLGQSPDDVGGLVGALAEEGLKSQVAAEKSRDDFRQSLSEAVESAFEDETSSERRKIVIFVDDLDRCRPTYAVAVLEAIKHLFSVQGLLFVMAIDEPQLMQALTTVYGTGLDANGYLRRFLDWRYVLPAPKNQEFCRLLADRFDFNGIAAFRESQARFDGQTLVTLSLYLDAFSVAAREIESLFTHLNLCFKANQKFGYPMYEVLVVAAVLRAKERSKLDQSFESLANAKALASLVNEKMMKVDPDATVERGSSYSRSLWAMIPEPEGIMQLEAHTMKMQEEMNRFRQAGVVKPPPEFTERDISDLTDVISIRREFARRVRINESPLRFALRILDHAGAVLR